MSKQRKDKSNSEVDAKEALPVPAEEVRAVIESEIGVPNNRGNNIFIGTLNVFTGAAQTVIDPIKKVCYEPFQTHWQERYVKKYPKHAGKFLILDLTLLTIFGALLVGGIFAYFVMPIFPQAQTVGLQVLAPEQVVSGLPTNFVVSYRNETGSPLTAAELKIRLPDGFVPETAVGTAGTVGATGTAAAPTAASADAAAAANPSAEPTNTRTFPLGDIKPFGQGEVRLAGTIFKPTGAKTNLSAELIYWREGESMPTRQAAYHDWLIEDAVFDVGFRVAEELVRGQQSAITITYANNGDTAIDGVVRFTAPDDFTLTGSDPRMTSRNEWSLKQLPPGTKGAITLTGLLRATSYQKAAPNFTIRGYIVKTETRYLTQETRLSVATLSSGFEISQEIAAPLGATSLKPGDEISVLIRYHNGGDKPLDDLRVTLQPTERYLEPLAKTETWSWNYHNSPELFRVESGASGTLTAKLKVKAVIGTDMLDSDPFPLLEIQTVAEYLTPTDKIRPIHAEAETLSLPINTSLGVKAGAFYYAPEGDQVGSGPLPPRVGEPTKYRVYLEVTNTTTLVHNARLEATLPTNVEWTGKFNVTHGQPLARLPDNNHIVWDIGDVVPDSSGVMPPTASFEVSLTPAYAEIGIEPLLLKDIFITGTDSGTDAKVSGGAENVTTSLTRDAKAAGKGTVQAAIN
jgi:hypothetical protein